MKFFTLLRQTFFKLMMTFAFLGLTIPMQAQAESQLNIVATIPALAQMAKTVVGEYGEVRSLAKVGQDPHFVPGKPTLARHLAKADVLVSVGLALESGWLPPLIELSRNSNIQSGAAGYFACSDYIDVIGHQGKTDRSMGDVHPEGNPHWWLDPIRVATVAQAFAKHLATLDPSHEADYVNNANAFSQQLHKLVETWQPKLKSTPNIITYHDSYRYFTDRFSIQVVGFVEPKPGVEASTRHLDDLVQVMNNNHVQHMWVESYHMGRVAERISSLSGAKIDELNDAIEGSGGTAYIHMIERMLQAASEE
ncbi:MAG: metal ABC transporter substrate-binding protein [Ghiorsea sp.]